VQPRLLRFDLDDWVSIPDVSAREQWSDARFQWLSKHPWQLLGGFDVVDVIFEVPA
jgi:hypothetical protein